MGKALKNSLVYALVMGLVCLSRLLPRFILLRVFDTLGRFLFLVLRKERAKTIRGLTSVFGDAWDTVRIRTTGLEVFRNLGRNLADILLSGNQSPESFFPKYADVAGWENFLQAHQRGKGVVCLSCHMGAFELLPHFMAWKGFRICVVGAALYDPRINRLVTGRREGHLVTYVERGSASAKSILSHLKSGDLFGVLPDQNTNIEGLPLPFLGIPAHTPVGPVRLSMKTGAAVVPFVIRRGPDNRHHITIEKEIRMTDTGNPEADLRANALEWNHVISEWIRQTPEQWVWMHERWKPG